MHDAEQLWLFDLDALDADEEDDEGLDDDWDDEENDPNVAAWRVVQETIRRAEERYANDHEPPSGICRRVTELG